MSKILLTFVKTQFTMDTGTILRLLDLVATTVLIYLLFRNRKAEKPNPNRVTQVTNTDVSTGQVTITEYQYEQN